MFFFLNGDCTFVLFVLCVLGLFSLKVIKCRGLNQNISVLLLVFQSCISFAKLMAVNFFLDACQSGVVVVRRELTQFQKLLY